MGLIEDAIARQNARPAPVKTDYAKLNAIVKQQRRQLAAAVRKGDVENLAAVIKSHVARWNEPDMIWPDDWSAWQRALDDALPWHQHIDIGEL